VQTRQNFTVVLLSLVAIGVALGVVLFFTTQPSQPTQAEMRAELMNHIKRLVPENAEVCGLVPLHSDSSTARECVSLALERQSAFWVASQTPFDDSDAWLLIFGGKDGSLQAVGFDSSPMGEPIEVAQYHASEPMACASLVVSADHWPPISCVQAQT